MQLLAEVEKNYFENFEKISKKNRTVDVLKDIAQGEGDLTRRLEIQSKDEIGELGRWFNAFIDNIQTIVRDVVGNAKKLNASSSDLAGISDQMSRNAEQTSGKCDAVAVSTEEMNTSTNTVASAMEEASSNMNMVASAAEEMTATINEIAQNSEKARTITGGAVTLAMMSQACSSGTSLQRRSARTSIALATLKSPGSGTWTSAWWDWGGWGGTWPRGRDRR